VRDATTLPLLAWLLTLRHRCCRTTCLPATPATCKHTLAYAERRAYYMLRLPGWLNNLWWADEDNNTRSYLSYSGIHQAAVVSSTLFRNGGVGAGNIEGRRKKVKRCNSLSIMSTAG